MITRQIMNQKEPDFINVQLQHSILIVEDEKFIREGLVRGLSHAYKTYAAANGREALEIIKKNSDIKVVISDLKMPEVDGLELLGKLRSENIKMDVIFVTAYFPIESEAYAMQMGAYDFMTKPVDLKVLETTIQNAIESKKADGAITLNMKEDVS
jgi:two-component system response regulator AtoC